VELSKPILNGDDEAALAETRAMTAWTLDQILKLLHPFMPFITEELWQKTAGERGRDTMLVNAAWPVYEGLGDADAAAEMEWVIRLITEIRSVRSEMNVPAGAKIACVLAHPSDESAARAKRWEAEISRLARLDSLTTADAVPEGSAQIVMDEAVIALPLAGVIDFAAEKARLAKELDKTAKDIAAIEGRLNNPGFVAKAPPAVIEEAKERREELSQRVSQVKDALGRLEAMG
jgi:valyl-tRNA synthetase